MAITVRRERLEPGDVLLYRPSVCSLYGLVIRWHTWHAVAHVENYYGGGFSAASRDGIGVGIYHLRENDLSHVLRPRVRFDRVRADTYTRRMLGTRYGWFDLLNFCGFNVDAPGIVCSPFVTERLRAGGVGVFNMEPARLIAPCSFLLSELLVDITSLVVEDGRAPKTPAFT